MLPRSSGACTRGATVFLVALLVIGARRWPQLAEPAVWVEDGVFVVPGLLEHGWRYIAEPLNGYLIVPSKITSWAALKVSFSHYAFVSTIIASLVGALSVSMIALSPSLLPARLALAFAAVLVPIYPEPFALPLYVFWWTGLLLFIGMFWRGDGVVLRSVCVLIGGLSSPLVVVLTPFFVLRLWFDRSKSTSIAAALAALIASLQAYFILTTSDSNSTHELSPTTVGLGVEKFFGFYVLVDSPWALAAGLAILALLLAGLFGTERPFAYILLGLCLTATMAASLGRMDVAAFHPIRAGPRYFYYPYILLSWMLIYLAVRGRPAVKLASVAVLALALIDLPSRFVRHQEAIVSWPEQVSTCLSQPTTTLIFKMNDKARQVWTRDFSRKLCEAGHEGALFP